jgi:hypothetical protein
VCRASDRLSPRIGSRNHPREPVGPRHLRLFIHCSLYRGWLWTISQSTEAQRGLRAVLLLATIGLQAMTIKSLASALS